MKKFTKIVKSCQECPNVSYIHFDGEWECAPPQYEFPVCTLVDVEEGGFKRSRHTTKTGIPWWCPLPDEGGLNHGKIFK